MARLLRRSGVPSAAVSLGAVVAVVAFVDCGLSESGTGTLASPVAADAGANDATMSQNADGALGVGDDSGPGNTADGGADDGGPCSVCSPTCLTACPTCSGSDDKLCIGTGAPTCLSDCANCTGNTTYCNVCPGGGGRVDVCGSASTGFCAGGMYDHCGCTTALTDCSGTNQVCSGGVCRRCGEAMTDSLTCEDITTTCSMTNHVCN
jgi:hypothetical protein